MTAAVQQKRSAAAGAAGERPPAASAPRRRTYDERDPLTAGGRRSSYVDDLDEDDEFNERDEGEGRRKSEEDVVFGPWPRRMLNRHVRAHACILLICR
jgi:hypothetical protein